MKELFQVVTLDEARHLIEGNFVLPGAEEEIKIRDAWHRRLAADIIAEQPVPGFDRSTVDGYAVRAGDTFGSSESLPALLTVAGEVGMGCQTKLRLREHEVAAIATGGMLPAGADAVVMIEYTERLDASTIEVARAVAPGENVLHRGEDIAGQELVLSRGTRLGPFELGLAAAAGRASVVVAKPLRVGVISTGEELVEPDVLPQLGQVRDINSYCLAGLITQAGAISVLYGIVKDNRDQLEKILQEAIRDNDLVVISGGSSVGVRDLTLDVLAGGLLFHGMAVRPGKPSLAAVLQGKLVVGLPGHPASAAIAFYLLVRPLLEWGSYRIKDKTIWATLGRNLASGPGREDYVRVKLVSQGQDTVAVPVLGKSGLISTLAEADGLIRIPLHKEGCSAGERIEVILL